MAKRLTDTELWEQDWYLELPNKYKLVWCYVKDKCDDAGIWRPNKSLLQRIIGEPINLNDFLTFINNEEKQRIKVLPTGRWFLREYFIFQYGSVFKPKSPVHRGALKKLLSNGLHINEFLGIESGKLKEVDLQQLKQIGYEKGFDSLLLAYEKGINRDKDKAIDTLFIDVFKELNILEVADQNFYRMVVKNMIDAYLVHKPGYIILENVDYRALLKIAYWIAERKGWSLHSVVTDKEILILDSWDKILDYIFNKAPRDYFRKLPLDGLAAEKNLRGILEEMKDYGQMKRDADEKNRISPEEYFEK